MLTPTTTEDQWFDGRHCGPPVVNEAEIGSSLFHEVGLTVRTRIKEDGEKWSPAETFDSRPASVVDGRCCTTSSNGH